VKFNNFLIIMVLAAALTACQDSSPTFEPVDNSGVSTTQTAVVTDTLTNIETSTQVNTQTSTHVSTQTSTQVNTQTDTQNTTLNDADMDGITDVIDLCPDTIGANLRNGCSQDQIEQSALAGEISYAVQCGNACHGNEQGENVMLGGSLTKSGCDVCNDFASLVDLIEKTMPLGGAKQCDKQCSINYANYILENFAGFNGNPDVDVDETLPLAGDIQACMNGIDAGYTGLKRLTRFEYNRVVNDIFNTNDDYSESFNQDAKVGNFSFNTVFALSEQQVQQHLETAEKVARSASENLVDWMPCDIVQNAMNPIDVGADQCNATSDCRAKFDGATDCKDSKSDQSICMCGSQACAQPSLTIMSMNEQLSAEACLDLTIETVIKKAYRRPVTDEEKEAFVSLYELGVKNSSVNDGIRLMIQAALSSPNFIYQFEFGGKEIEPGLVELSQYELAGRLAFYLWRSVPDEALLAAADNNELSTQAQIRAQAERMLDDEKSKAVVAQFHKEWMQLLEPIIGDEHEELMRAANVDTVNTIISLVFNDDASFESLFDVPYGFLNEQTLDLYEVNSMPTGQLEDGYARYELESDRQGLLTRSSFLMSNSPPSGRGGFVREQVLCGHVPPPPVDVDTALKDIPDPDASPREKWRAHLEQPGCGGCHILLDPLGFAFDHYDRTGKWRDNLVSVSGKKWPVEDTGEVVATSDIDGMFTGAIELQNKLASSEDSKACYNSQWLRYATGRAPSVGDSCSLAMINMAAKNANYNIRDIMISVTLTDAFRHARTEKNETNAH